MKYEILRSAPAAVFAGCLAWFATSLYPIEQTSDATGMDTGPERGGDWPELYVYEATLERVIDGDTVVLDIDLGMRVTIQDETIRLADIDAPEIRGASAEAGRATKDQLTSLLAGKRLVIKTHKDQRGKFGRYLADLYVATEAGWLHANRELVARGLAKPSKGWARE